MKDKLSIFVVAALASTAVAQPAPPTPAPAPAPEPTPAPAADPATAEPAPPPMPPAPAADDQDQKTGTAGYDKGFFIRNADGTYALKISGRVQPFYTLNVGRDPLDLRSAFEIRRARLTLGGHLHTRALTYKLQTDLGKGFVTLKDFHVDAEFAQGTWLRVGQWKRPFSRQQINSSSRLEITDRSITDKAFLGGRDIGLAIHNNYEKSPDFEWIVGVFNGTGDGSKFKPAVDPMTGAVTGGAFSNVPGKLRPVWVARAGINRNGIKGYSEADLEGGPLRFAAAANLAVEGDNDDDDSSQQRAGVDYVVKAEGFSTTGGFYLMTEQTDLKLTDQELSFLGFHLQAGYMVAPKLQAAARYALVDARLDDAKDQQEITIGGNYYAFGHDGKLAAAVRFIKTGDAGFDDGILVEIGANVGF
jgi:hypothetical protein